MLRLVLEDVLSKAFGRRDVFQVVGYLLLDYEDELEARAVGLYSARRGDTWRADAGELLQRLSGDEADLI